MMLKQNRPMRLKELDPAAAASTADPAEKAAAPCEGGRPAPRHVAIIMDGNGRWAGARKLPRLAGHRAGVERLRDILKTAPELGVEFITFYAFSTENWRRPAAEVAGLMQLFRMYMKREANQLHRDGVRILFIGDRSKLAPDLQKLMGELETLTQENTRITALFAINYGARAEIVLAARRLAEKAAAGEIDASAVDEDALCCSLDTADIPDPDLLIRTSGEQRLSNFLLWQAAYAELFFAPEPWPDFTPEVFSKALEAYADRDRRYGAVSS